MLFSRTQTFHFPLALLLIAQNVFSRNAVPFTPTQVEAIRAGMQPGLTMVGVSTLKIAFG